MRVRAQSAESLPEYQKKETFKQIVMFLGSGNFQNSHVAQNNAAFYF